MLVDGEKVRIRIKISFSFFGFVCLILFCLPVSLVNQVFLSLVVFLSFFFYADIMNSSENICIPSMLLGQNIPNQVNMNS